MSLVAYMPSVIDPALRAERPAYVRFSRTSTEDRDASIKAGHTVERHLDMALISITGTRDIVEREVEGWFDNLRLQVREGQIQEALLNYYQKCYEAWCDGQEMPPSGTPILGWQLLTSTEQKRVIDSGIRTVEDLAESTYAHQQQIGMGAPAMAAKAQSWIAVGRDKGRVAMQISDLEAQVAVLTAQLASANAPKIDAKATKK